MVLIKNNVMAEQVLDSFGNISWRIKDDNGVVLLETVHKGLVFILEDLLNNRGSELDLNTGWV